MVVESRDKQKSASKGKQTKAEVENKPQTTIKRGQKTRLNKMKTKYKDQDEEDREIAMQVLKVNAAQFFYEF